jgi:hypothetical protein
LEQNGGLQKSGNHHTKLETQAAANQEETKAYLREMKADMNTQMSCLTSQMNTKQGNLDMLNAVMKTNRAEMMAKTEASRQKIEARMELY